MKSVVKRAFAVAAAGAAIYLVLPSLIAVLGSWPRLSTLNPVWFAAAPGRRPTCCSAAATARRHHRPRSTREQTPAPVKDTRRYD